MEIINSKAKERPLDLPGAQVSRRGFLRWTGIFGAVAVTSLSSCYGDDSLTANTNEVDLGSGDVGILNYAYALEQLEAAFYTQVVASPYAGISDLERTYMEEIRDHEIAHREFFKTALGTAAIGALEVDFSSINFGSRDSVLGTAKAFEDLGVSAYNGAGKLLTDVNNLLIAGKIVSVEARHAALIRDLISNGSFADNTVVDAMGLDVSRMPMDVLAIADPYIITRVSGRNLPTS